MIKPTPEQIDAYTRLLKAREQRLRAELVVRERGINRVHIKLANVEKSLRSDLREGIKSVYEAIGVPLPQKIKQAPAAKEDALVTGATQEMDLEKSPAAPAPAPGKKKGFFDDIFGDD